MFLKPPVMTSVFQGDFKVSNDPAVCLMAILGSCVATCLFDEDAKIGGLNHFLLPRSAKGADSDLRYGVQSMELLINALLKTGANKANLKAKVFGGAQMLDEFSNIGQRNAEFAYCFLDDENIPYIAKCTAGNQARRIRFWPTTGRAQQMLVARTEAPLPTGPQKSTPDLAKSEVVLF